MSERPGGPASGCLIALLLIAIGLSVAAGGMAVWIRGLEYVAHELRDPRSWHADAYACALVGAAACLAWTAFFAAAWRRIAARRSSSLQR